MPAPSIFRADVEHLDGLGTLSDAYRTFYRQLPDLDGARRFLTDRLTKGESGVFLAELLRSDELAGFTLLYPTFSSVRMRRAWTLNDLFVAEPVRGRSVARALMEAARAFAVETGAASIHLETEASNAAAQALYDSLGYERDDGHVHYAPRSGGRERRPHCPGPRTLRQATPSAHVPSLNGPRF